MDAYFKFLDWFYSSGGEGFLSVVKFISGLLSIVFFALIIIIVRLSSKLGSPLGAVEEVLRLDFGKIPTSSRKEASKQWDSIMGKANSMSQSDWKLAVIEADSLVDDLLKLAQFKGETMGDRLKQLDTSKLSSLNSLWEAHKIRNIIAHDPNQALTRAEIDRALSGFKKSLDELEFLDETYNP